MRRADPAQSGGRDFWIRHFQGVQRTDDYFADGEVAEPFVIRRDDVPRRFFSAAVCDSVLISGLVPFPVLALFKVGGGSFPVFGGIGQARVEAAVLLGAAHVQKEFQDD